MQKGHCMPQELWIKIVHEHTILFVSPMWSYGGAVISVELPPLSKSPSTFFINVIFLIKISAR